MTTDRTEQTLAELAAEYRRNADRWRRDGNAHGQIAADPEERTGNRRVGELLGERAAGHAADWDALADWCEFGAMAAPRWEGAEERLIAAAHRLAAHLGGAR